MRIGRRQGLHALQRMIRAGVVDEDGLVVLPPDHCLQGRPNSIFCLFACRAPRCMSPGVFMLSRTREEYWQAVLIDLILDGRSEDGYLHAASGH